jgi:hypothetical protein
VIFPQPEVPKSQLLNQNNNKSAKRQTILPIDKDLYVEQHLIFYFLLTTIQSVKVSIANAERVNTNCP